MAQTAETTKILEVTSLAQLPEAAAAFVSFLPASPTVLFEGEMGAGKTTFIKAICRELGVTDPVSSPTFSLVNEYRTREGKIIYHFDFYRINDESEAINIGFYEYLDSGNMCLIEWPARIPNLLPDHFVEVTITAGTGEERTITLKQT